MAQFREPRHSAQVAPWSQRGHGSHARRPVSAWGSIGSTVSHPIREHAGGDQFVVGPLLLVVEI